MEKLGVVVADQAETKDEVKTASVRHCPKCKEQLPRQAEQTVDWCPNCGTEPFEKKA